MCELFTSEPAAAPFAPSAGSFTVAHTPHLSSGVGCIAVIHLPLGVPSTENSLNAPVCRLLGEEVDFHKESPPPTLSVLLNHQISVFSHPFSPILRERAWEGSAQQDVFYCAPTQLPLRVCRVESDHAHVAGPSETPEPRGAQAECG